VAKQKFGLGRGLDALISGASEVMSAQQPAEAQTTLELSIESIMPNPRQPRRAFREDDPKLLELCDSIREHGVLQPIIVARRNDIEGSNKAANAWFTGDEQPSLSPLAEKADEIQFQIIAGERRWRAARLAGLTKIPAVVKEVTPQQILELALIENIQRADLNPIEEALAYQSLVQEFNLTQEMVAKRVGKDRTTVNNALRLLQLAPKVREALINQPENFSEGHARALIGIACEEDQITAMGKIISLRLNVRQAEELASRIKASEDVQVAAQQVVANVPHRSPELEEMETQFRNAFMVKVDLKCNAKGKGTLVLHFNDSEELENLYSRFIKDEASVRRDL